MKTSPRYRVDQAVRQLAKAREQLAFAQHNLRIVRDDPDLFRKAEVRRVLASCDRAGLELADADAAVKLLRAE